MDDICVSIVNTNEKEAVGKCLTSLYKDSINSGLKFKVVIIDNNSNDNIEEFEKIFFNLSVIAQEKNEGFGKSHNRTIEEIEARYYFILNPDTIFPENGNFLRQMYDFMESNPKIGIAGPKILYPDKTLQYSCYRFPSFFQPIYSRTKFGQSERGEKIMERFLMKDFFHNKTRPVDWIMGSAMFARAKAIYEVGGFDDMFWMYAEDSDWCRRMWENNWCVYYVHNVVLLHTYGRASAKVSGILNALIKNKYARAHLWSWFKYFWKWCGTNKYYF